MKVFSNIEFQPNEPICWNIFVAVSV